MPFGKREVAGEWKVYNKETGDVKGTHSSEEKANAQLRALYANVPDVKGSCKRASQSLLELVCVKQSDVVSSLDESVPSTTDISAPAVEEPPVSTQPKKPLKTVKPPNGYVVWEGPSLIDGVPIVVILTTTKSDNVKTGDMAQTWILLKDIPPMEALQADKDISICGNCIHRTKRDCYVQVMQRPRTVYNSYKAGKYPKLTDDVELKTYTLRFGSYGDPAAAPDSVWSGLAARGNPAGGRTGYTHQWYNVSLEERKSLNGLPTGSPLPDSPGQKHWAAIEPYAAVSMLSVDTPQEYDVATNWGGRTFRVRNTGDPLLAGEIVCPASFEWSLYRIYLAMGKKLLTQDEARQLYHLKKVFGKGKPPKVPVDPTLETFFTRVLSKPITCTQCGACGGITAKKKVGPNGADVSGKKIPNVTIMAHGQRHQYGVARILAAQAQVVSEMAQLVQQRSQLLGKSSNVKWESVLAPETVAMLMFVDKAAGQFSSHKNATRQLLMLV